MVAQPARHKSTAEAAARLPLKRWIGTISCLDCGCLSDDTLLGVLAALKLIPLEPPHAMFQIVTKLVLTALLAASFTAQAETIQETSSRSATETMVQSMGFVSELKAQTQQA